MGLESLMQTLILTFMLIYRQFEFKNASVTLRSFERLLLKL